MKKAITSKSEVIVFLIISASIFSIFLVGGYTTNKITLLRPRWNVPVIRMANESFTIEAKGDFPLPSNIDLRASIHSAVGVFDLLLDSISVDGNKIQANARFPAGVEPDVLYNLSISAGRWTDEQPNAVKIVSNYRDDFKIIVLADTQVGYSPEYEDTWLYSYSNFEETVDQINLINPEFVVLVGDITETALKSEYEFIYENCLRLEVPIFAGPGNHDYFNTEEYKRWCYYFNFSFNYGPDYHFTYINTGMNLNGIHDDDISWLAQDLSAHESSVVKIVLGHAPPYECDKASEPADINRNFEENVNEFIDLLNEHDVMAYLYGHNHKDKVNVYPNCVEPPANQSVNSTLFIQTNDGKEDGGYRLISFRNNTMTRYSRLINATILDQRGSWSAFSDPSNIETKNLEVKTNVSDTSGNGSLPSGIECNVTNRFEYESFTNMTLRLTLAGNENDTFNIVSNSTGFFRISRIVSRIDLNNAMIVHVNFDLPSATSINFKVWRSSP
ncbi:MAG: metallophosphoesterase family protein [Promethearchaeota archaeon]